MTSNVMGFEALLERERKQKKQQQQKKLASKLTLAAEKERLKELRNLKEGGQVIDKSKILSKSMTNITGIALPQSESESTKDSGTAASKISFSDLAHQLYKSKSFVGLTMLNNDEQQPPTQNEIQESNTSNTKNNNNSSKDDFSISYVTNCSEGVNNNIRVSKQQNEPNNSKQRLTRKSKSFVDKPLSSLKDDNDTITANQGAQPQSKELSIEPITFDGLPEKRQLMRPASASATQKVDPILESSVQIASHPTTVHPLSSQLSVSMPNLNALSVPGRPSVQPLSFSKKDAWSEEKGNNQGTELKRSLSHRSPSKVKFNEVLAEVAEHPSLKPTVQINDKSQPIIEPGVKLKRIDRGPFLKELESGTSVLKQPLPVGDRSPPAVDDIVSTRLNKLTRAPLVKNDVRSLDGKKALPPISTNI